MIAFLVWVFRFAGLPLWGFTYQVTWNWFGPIVFPAPEMAPWTFKQGVAAVALMCLVKMRWSRKEYDASSALAKADAADKYQTQLRYTLASSLFLPLLTLGFNWLIYLAVRP